MPNIKMRDKQREQEDFFKSFETGQTLAANWKKLQLEKQRQQLDFVAQAMENQMQEQKLRLEMLKGGLDPASGRPLQRGAFNPQTGQPQDVLYDAGTPGNVYQGTVGYGGGGAVYPKSAPQAPAIRADQIETDKSGRTYVNLGNGVRMPAVITLGPGGAVTRVRTFTPGGREAFLSVIRGDSGAGTGSGVDIVAPAAQEPPQPEAIKPITFEQAVGMLDQAIMQGLSEDEVLSMIDSSKRILADHKKKLRVEARRRYGKSVR